MPMSNAIPDPTTLTRLLGRGVIAVETEREMGMERVVALRLEPDLRFELPAGNALRSAGEILEIRALLEGLPRRVAEALRRRLGPGDPAAAEDAMEALLRAALADPDG